MCEFHLVVQIAVLQNVFFTGVQESGFMILIILTEPMCYMSAYDILHQHIIYNRNQSYTFLDIYSHTDIYTHAHTHYSHLIAIFNLRNIHAKYLYNYNDHFRMQILANTILARAWRGSGVRWGAFRDTRVFG